MLVPRPCPPRMSPGPAKLASCALPSADLTFFFPSSPCSSSCLAQFRLDARGEGEGLLAAPAPGGCEHAGITISVSDRREI